MRPTFYMTHEEIARALSAEDGEYISPNDVYRIERNALKKCWLRLKVRPADLFTDRARELLPIPQYKMVLEEL